MGSTGTGPGEGFWRPGLDRIPTMGVELNLINPIAVVFAGQSKIQHFRVRGDNTITATTPTPPEPRSKGCLEKENLSQHGPNTRAPCSHGYHNDYDGHLPQGTLIFTACHVQMAVYSVKSIMSASSSQGGGESAASEPRSSSIEKTHPSEYLEFATVGPNLDRITTTADVPPSAATVELVETHVDPTKSSDELYHGLSASVPGLRRLSADARAATEAERKLTFWSGCRLYPKAIAWSLLLSTTIIMEGYDLTLINSFYAFPIFRRSYGEPIHPNNPEGQQNFQISARWQSGLTNAAVAGEIIGLFFNGLLTDRFGYHKTMVATLVWISLSVFLAFFAVNIRMLLASQILCGIPWGIFQTLSTTYAAEVMPVHLRAYLTSNVNMCWLIGQTIGVGVIRALVRNTSQWSYRIPFGLQWAFAVPILVGVLFAPESPWWLIRHDKVDEARKALIRLTSKSDKEDESVNVDEAIAMMRHTNEVEKYLQNNSGGMTYTDCFRGTDRRRTEIACMVWVTQALCGATLTGFAAYFYEQAGFSTTNSFTLAVSMYGLAIVGGIISWFLLPSIGRRRLYLYGLLGCFIVLMVAGGIAKLPGFPGQSWSVGSLIIILTFVYDMTIGPVCYVLVAEIPSTRLRVKTVVLARVAYNVASLVINVLTPLFLNPTALNWQGQSCFFFAGTTTICFIWCFFRLPEPKGLSYLELDILFENKAKARKFRQFQVNLASTGYFSLTRNEHRNSVWRGYG
ncbi:hypothetical protein R6Q59_010024 [Mikania micrantha]